MKHTDIIREALNYAWSYVESHHRQMLGDDNEHAAAQTKADLDRIDAALSALKAMEEQEPFPAVDFRTIPDDQPAPLVLAYLRACAKSHQGDVRLLGNLRAKDIVRVVDQIESHPAPSAPVDLAGIIEAGDKMRDSINDHINDIPKGHQPLRSEQFMIQDAKAWTSATKPFRKP